MDFFAVIVVLVNLLGLVELHLQASSEPLSSSQLTDKRTVNSATIFGNLTALVLGLVNRENSM